MYIDSTPTEINTSHGVQNTRRRFWYQYWSSKQPHETPMRFDREMFFQSDLISASRVQRLAASRRERKRQKKKKGKENESVSCKGISMFPCDWWKRGCITMKSFDSQLRGRTYITSVGLEISKGRSILRRDNYLKQQTRVVFPLLTTD